MEGKEAGNVVASELAAMFDLSVLPTLRAHYIDPADPQAYEDKCKAFAAQIGLPAHEWPRITLPAFLSMDWDTRHSYVRTLMSAPRMQPQELQRRQRHAYEDAFGISTPHKVQTVGAAVDLREALGVGLDEEQMLERERRNALQVALSSYQAQHGVDLWLLTQWRDSIMLPELCCLLPQQFMPLSKVSPDMHCVVEHMVGTVKACVRQQLLDRDLNDRELWKGRAYQAMLLKAVLERGNGPRGLHHVRRSVEKWPCTCAILAADEGEDVVLHYTFGKSGPNKQSEHVVKGTAGQWIRISKWT